MAVLPKPPFLYPIVDTGLLRGRPPGPFVLALVRAGARLLQLRARETLGAARSGGALLLVNDRPDVARIVGADGVHLGQEDLDPRDVRGFLGKEAILGFSTHTPSQVRDAPHDVLDYIAIGPIFETRTKARPDPVVGPALVREARGLTSLPLVAIGGLSPENLGRVVEAGASGLALASALDAPEGPEAAFRVLARAPSPSGCGA
jgi:thiamine-phosphate pyrophosphorylase